MPKSALDEAVWSITHLPPPLPYPLKSNSGMEAFPNCSGAFRCLLESGEPLAFWFKIPNRVRVRIDSRGRIATATGKLILKQHQNQSEGWSHVLKQVSNCVEAADSQFIPLDVVKKVLVGSNSLGLDGFKEVLSIVGEGAHQVVLLITMKEQPEPE